MRRTAIGHHESLASPARVRAPDCPTSFGDDLRAQSPSRPPHGLDRIGNGPGRAREPGGGAPDGAPKKRRAATSIGRGLVRRVHMTHATASEPAILAPVAVTPEAPLSRAPRQSTLRRVAFWATTLLGPSSFVIGGVLHLQGGKEVIAGLHHLGYPTYFASILGVWKILGAVTITVPGLPRLKEWAYAGFFFDLTAAAASRAFSGDGVGDVVAPLVFLALVMASWALRPQSRMLPAANASRAR